MIPRKYKRMQEVARNNGFNSISEMLEALPGILKQETKLTKLLQQKTDL